MSTFSTVVITSDNHKEIKEILTNLLKIGIKKEKLIVIDNSILFRSQKINEKIITSLNLNYIRSGEILDILSRHGFEIKNYIKSFSRNVGTIRNLATLIVRDRYVLFLDDDISISSQIVNSVEKHKFKNPVIGFYLKSGIPDCSLLEWYEFWVYYHLYKWNKTNFMSYIYNKRSYPRKLFEKGTQQLINYVAKLFEAIFIKEKQPVLNFDISFPKRRFVHGGCFFVPKDILMKVPMPFWYDEDVSWCKLLKFHKIKFTLSKRYFFHLQSQRLIKKLHKNRIFYEEFGKLIDNTIKRSKNIAYLKNKEKMKSIVDIARKI